jgi:hypothetical protein
MEPLGWDEIVSQPGMGGYLSFLNGPVPLPHLQPAPEVESTPPTNTVPVLDAASTETHQIPEVESIPVATSRSGFGSTSEPEAGTQSLITTETGFASASRAKTTPGDHSIAFSPIPGVVSGPAIASTRRPRIRKCAAAHDGHSLGEEVLYQALWKAAVAETVESRTITVGWRGMSQLCRMTPKNCKINTQRLIRKLALEVLSPYNTPESIGTTYRIYSADAILRRRHERGLEWVVRSRGVEFVDPSTGQGITAHLCGYVSE